MIQTILVFLIFAATVFFLLKKPVSGLVSRIWMRVHYSRDERLEIERQKSIARFKAGQSGDEGCGVSCHCSFEPSKKSLAH